MGHPMKVSEAVERARSEGVGAGMVIAAAIVVRTWGNTVYAHEILGAAGCRSFDDLRKWQVDAYDVWPLRATLRRVWRRPDVIGCRALSLAVEDASK